MARKLLILAWREPIPDRLLVRSHIDEQHSPSGYNLGLNIGESAGQTADHAHLHIVPRYKDDVADPRGGVRWVLPERAAYWLKQS